MTVYVQERAGINEQHMLFGLISGLADWLAGHVVSKDRLVRQLRSRDRGEVERAHALATARGWLRNGKLEGAILAGADLQRLELCGAMLMQVDFYRANLAASDLRRTNLCNANLTLSNLQDADLSYASLTNAYLWGADLRGANLTGADLRGAFVSRDDLQRALDDTSAALDGTLFSDAHTFRMDPLEWDRAFPHGTRFDERTILPDGSAWAEGVSLARFITTSISSAGSDYGNTP